MWTRYRDDSYGNCNEQKQKLIGLHPGTELPVVQQKACYQESAKSPENQPQEMFPDDMFPQMFFQKVVRDNGYNSQSHYRGYQERYPHEIPGGMPSPAVPGCSLCVSTPLIIPKMRTRWAKIRIARGSSCFSIAASPCLSAVSPPCLLYAGAFRA